jgi:glycosyltransferase involved in cell wall biosynthesis
VNFDVYICPSKWLYKKTLESKPFHKDKIYWIPNALNTRRFAPKSINFKSKIEEVIIFFGGKDDHLKGGDLVIEFLNKLDNNKSTYSAIKFHIVGKPIEGKFKNFEILNYGFVNEDFLISLYQKSQVCLNFSRHENLCQFLTQACSCGLSLIAFDIGGNSDIIYNDKNGFLIEPFALDSYISRFLMILEGDNLTFSQYSREHAIANWSYEIIAERHLNVYKSLQF